MGHEQPCITPCWIVCFTTLSRPYSPTGRTAALCRQQTFGWSCAYTAPLTPRGTSSQSDPRSEPLSLQHAVDIYPRENAGISVDRRRRRRRAGTIRRFEYRRSSSSGTKPYCYGSQLIGTAPLRAIHLQLLSCRSSRGRVQLRFQQSCLDTSAKVQCAGITLAGPEAFAPIPVTDLVDE